MRRKLRNRELGVDIAGISQKLEDLSPEVEEHGGRWVDTLVGAAITIVVQARSNKDVEVERAQRIENFLYTLFYDWQRRKTSHSFDPDRGNVDQQVFYGCGPYSLEWEQFLSELFRSMDLAGEEKFIAALRKADSDDLTVSDEGKITIHRNPFRLASPQVSSMAWEPDLSAVCEVGIQKISSLARAYPHLDFANTTSDTRSEEDEGDEQPMATVFHLETEKYIYNIVDQANYGEPVELEQVLYNPAKRPWYALSPGRFTSDPNPRDRYKPLIQGVYPTVQHLNLLRTLVESGALQTGRNMWQQVKDGNRGDDFMSLMSKPADEAPVIRVDTSRDMLPPPQPGFRWEPVAVPDQSQLITALEQKKQDLSNHGYPAILDPSTPIAAESGYDRARQMEAAGRFLKPPLENRAYAIKECFMIVADVIKNMGITLEYPMLMKGQGERNRVMQKITPEDFQDFDLNVQFSSVPESVRMAQRESALGLVDRGYKSRASFMEEEYDDPAAEMERIKQEQLQGPLDEMITQTAMQIIQGHLPMIASSAAAEAGVPFAGQGIGQPGPQGGPAPGQEVVEQRPPMGAFPGVGAPQEPPPQTQADGVNPAMIG